MTHGNETLEVANTKFKKITEIYSNSFNDRMS